MKILIETPSSCDLSGILGQQEMGASVLRALRKIGINSSALMKPYAHHGAKGLKSPSVVVGAVVAVVVVFTSTRVETRSLTSIWPPISRSSNSADSQAANTNWFGHIAVTGCQYRGCTV